MKVSRNVVNCCIANDSRETQFHVHRVNNLYQSRIKMALMYDPLSIDNTYINIMAKAQLARDPEDQR